MTQVTHILYLSEKPGQNPFSGAENHIVALVCGLAAKGVDVELVVLVWNDGRIIQDRLAAIRKAGVTVTEIFRPGEGFLRTRLVRAGITWNRLRRHLKTIRNRIVHIHLDLVVVPVLVRLLGIRRAVLSVHNDEPVYRSRRWQLWLRFIDRWISHYIGITDHVVNYYRTMSGVAHDKIRRIYYGVRRPACVEQDFSEYGVPGDTVKVGFVGRLTEQKNLFTLLDAFKGLDRVSLVLIGEGPLREPLKAHARHHGIDNVYFTGAIPDAASLMCNFDVFCMPSLWEGLGLVFIEAMLSKVPVIGSKAGAIPEVLGQGRYGILVDTGSPAELRGVLSRVEGDLEKLRERAASAFHYAEERFSEQRMIGETIEVYRLVEAQARGR